MAEAGWPHLLRPPQGGRMDRRAGAIRQWQRVTRTGGQTRTRAKPICCRRNRKKLVEKTLSKRKMFNSINIMSVPSHGRGRRFNPYSAHHFGVKSVHFVRRAFTSGGANFLTVATSRRRGEAALQPAKNPSLPSCHGCDVNRRELASTYWPSFR